MNSSDDSCAVAHPPHAVTSTHLAPEKATDGSTTVTIASGNSKSKSGIKFTSREMVDAMYEVLVNRMSLNGAIAKLRLKSLPRSTLSLKLQLFCESKFKHKKYAYLASDERISVTRIDLEPFAEVHRRGRYSLLNLEQEYALASFLYYFSLEGISISTNLVKKIIQAMAIPWELTLKNGTITKGFLSSFRERHPELAVRDGAVLDEIRKAGETHISPFFEQIRLKLEKIHPDLIGNLDETMCGNKPKHVKVIGASMAKVASMCGTETENPHISLMPVILASGKCLVSLIIEGSTRKETIPHTEDCEDFVFAATPNGFIDSKTFQAFVHNTLIPRINKHRVDANQVGKTFFLLMDGHAAHSHPPVLNELHENNIVAVFMPPHTSHLIQPLDRSPFHAFKRKLYSYLTDSHTLAGKPNIRTRVEKIMEAWRNVTKETIANGFMFSGFYPFDSQRALKKINHEEPILILSTNKNKIEKYCTPMIDNRLPGVDFAPAHSVRNAIPSVAVSPVPHDKENGNNKNANLALNALSIAPRVTTHSPSPPPPTPINSPPPGAQPTATPSNPDAAAPPPVENAAAQNTITITSTEVWNILKTGKMGKKICQRTSLVTCSGITSALGDIKGVMRGLSAEERAKKKRPRPFIGGAFSDDPVYMAENEKRRKRQKLNTLKKEELFSALRNAQREDLLITEEGGKRKTPTMDIVKGRVMREMSFIDFNQAFGILEDFGGLDDEEMEE